MNLSRDHNNWLSVGVVIDVIKKPVALYTSYIVQEWHFTLCKDCLPFGRCATPENCQTKKKPSDLCPSCKGWYKELAKSHRNKDKRRIKWNDNCDTPKWPDDPWEVAKFFMPVLGDNKGTTKDAESTDLSSLLNVLIWMKDVAFPLDRRVHLDLAIQLRSKVRNPWAHAPNQELTNADLFEAFDIANKFVADLDNVFSCDEVKKCIDDIKFLSAHGVCNVAKAELVTLFLLRNELCSDVNQLKGEIKGLKEAQSTDRQIIKDNERMLQNLEKCTKQCLTRMEKDIGDNRADIKSLQDIVDVHGTGRRFRLKSSIPDKPPTIIGRGTEVNKIISSLMEDGCGIVSIVGGPGFGKSTVAREVSHQLRNNHDIIVIFSFLSNASTLSEVLLRLCCDFGVNPGNYPESSLMLRLKTNEKKVVLVMDNIEHLLEKDSISKFTELVVTLRTSSQPQLQILTTTRTAFSNLDRTTKNIQMGELDEKSSVELLKTYCPKEEVKYEYLSEMAGLCGFVPLALCIAGSRIPDLADSSELIQWLKKKPMKALQTSSKSQSVRKAIEFSFQMLSNEDKKAFVRLSVFNGNFQKSSAQDVIERDGLETQNFLVELVARSLIQNSSDKRFLIHSLIRRFLTDNDQLQDQKAIAQALMVKHFLKVCHSMTIDSYSKDRFSVARELLKKDIHNIEETLKICNQDEATNLNPNVIKALTNSDIYKYSSRFFHDFGWDLLPQTVLRNFHEHGIQLAEDRGHVPIQITFQCLVADQEGRESAWKSDEYINRMAAIKEFFDRNKAVLKQDRSLFRYCYYFYARYNSSNKPNTRCPDLPEDDFAHYPENKVRSSFESIDEALILIERGHLNKKCATKIKHSDKEKYMEYMNSAELYYNQALSSVKELLGDHELTCTCHKVLGDLYFAWWKNEEALTHYFDAIKLRKKLELDSSEPFVFLLKNYGLCLSCLRRFDESMEKLNEARDIADKLGKTHTPCIAKVYYALATACRAWKPDCQEAAKYAKAAMEMQELLDKHSVKTLEEIIYGFEYFQTSQLESCIPNKPRLFIGRMVEVEQIIFSLVENGCGIISIFGAPGFGKSTVAVNVSHVLSNKHGIVVIFSSLSNVSTVPEVVVRLCRDVGVIPGEDPESSLMVWLGNLEKRVVLVMDDIEQLLESDVRTLTDLVVTLRKKSRQQLQILTTTRTEFLIPDRTSENVQIRELDEKSSVELLRTYCPKQEVKYEYLSELAGLCGFVPLALCIAGSRIPDIDDPYELIQSLREKTMEVYKKSNQSQCVLKAIDFSFQRLSDEDKKALVRLSVFDGNFETISAQEVIGRNVLDTQDFLKNLVSRSLLQNCSDKRFVIHSFIRRFLADDEEFQDQIPIARELMVKHFLKVCHSLTMAFYSKDGFTVARELLKSDCHNVEETFKVCSQNQTVNLNTNIIELLASSDIYKSSSRLFYNFGRDLFSQTALRNFHESCIKLAKSRKEPIIDIKFQCLVADQEGRISSYKSDEYNEMMKAIKKAFDTNKALLKEDRSLFRYCYYFLARYYNNKDRNIPYPDLPDPDLPEDDLAPSSDSKTRSPIKNVDEALISIERAHLNKICATRVNSSDKEKYEDLMNCAKLFYNQALSFAKEWLGDHEVTFVCHKLLGDLYSRWAKNKEALKYYSDAKQLSKKLHLDSDQRFVSMLKSCGLCLSFRRRFYEAVKLLNEARDVADKLSVKHTQCRAGVYFALARTCRVWKPDCQEAAKYADVIMEMRKKSKVLDARSVEILEDIIKTAEK